MHAGRCIARIVRASVLLTLPASAVAQDVSSFLHHLPNHVVLPQRHVIIVPPAPHPLPHPLPRSGDVRLVGVEADVSIRSGIATTALTIRLENPGHARAEAVVLLPVPDQAVVRSFTFDGLGAGVEARLLPREEARRIYDAIVARARDPALLEFAGLNVVRSSAFPLEPRRTQSVTLTYEHVLPADGSRRDYVLPRSQALDADVPWTIRVHVHGQHPLGAIYSPSHHVAIDRAPGDPRRATVTLTPGAGRTPGTFLLSFLEEGTAGANATVFVHEDADGRGGHFLLLVAAPREPERTAARLRREVTLVLDRSGSMRGEKLEQAKEAARQLIAGLEPGERFHLITYNEVVETYREEPESVTPESRRRALAYIDALTARGGTNFHDALREALRAAPAAGFVPVVLFLTDGLPTVGETSEKAIRELASARNPHHRRIFTFGVGAEVNTPLLQSVALAARGVPTYVLPGEDIEVKMTAVFRRLAGPFMAGPKLTVAGAPDDGGATTRSPGVVQDVLPHPLPDIFAGDETLILGRYRGNRPFDLVLTEGAGDRRTIRARVDPAATSPRHSFVPRLWASRQIGMLVAALRDLGADGRDPQSLQRDPAARELIDEVVRLSTEFGILTEYTAFLAEEARPLPAPAAFAGRALERFAASASQRSGEASLSLDANNAGKLSQRVLNPANRAYDETLTVRDVRSIQPVAEIAFYRRDGRWIDSRLALIGGAEPQVDRVVTMGTAAHRELIDRLLHSNRQAAAALPGDVYLAVDGETVLLRNR